MFVDEDNLNALYSRANKNITRVENPSSLLFTYKIEILLYNCNYYEWHLDNLLTSNPLLYYKKSPHICGRTVPSNVSKLCANIELQSNLILSYDIGTLKISLYKLRGICWVNSFFYITSVRWTKYDVTFMIFVPQAVPYSRDYKRKYEYLKSQLKKPVSTHILITLILWYWYWYWYFYFDTDYILIILILWNSRSFLMVLTGDGGFNDFVWLKFLPICSRIMYPTNLKLKSGGTQFWKIRTGSYRTTPHVQIFWKPNYGLSSKVKSV